jgi:hypothetical protein
MRGRYAMAAGGSAQALCVVRGREVDGQARLVAG